MSDAWLKLAVPAADLAVPALEQALEEAGALAVSVEALDDTHPRFSTPGLPEPALWPDCVVEGLFPATLDADALLAALAAAGCDVTGARRELLGDEDWQFKWREHFVPLAFAGDLWVVPSWHQVPAAARRYITLDPGMAFGTGTHPTTGLCLDWLGGEAAPAGKSVLDYGCGSGILAIAAARHGARHIVGVDIDPDACTVARDNARHNGCEAIDFVLPAMLAPGVFDVLVANILLNPLLGLVDEFASRLVPGGRIGLSGLLAEQVDFALAAYGTRFKMNPPELRGEWAFLSGRKGD